MMPTFSERHYVLMRGYSSNFNKIERGDVISLKAPDKNQRLGKRIVELPGDIVERRNHKGQFVIIPPNHCWVEGDNGQNIRDSNAFGPVPLELIRAKRIAVLLPSVERLVRHALPDEMMMRVTKRTNAIDSEIIPTDHLSCWGNFNGL